MSGRKRISRITIDTMEYLRNCRIWHALYLSLAVWTIRILMLVGTYYGDSSESLEDWAGLFREMKRIVKIKYCIKWFKAVRLFSHCFIYIFTDKEGFLQKNFSDIFVGVKILILVAN